MLNEKLRVVFDHVALELAGLLGVSLVMLIRRFRRGLQVSQSDAQNLEVQTVTKEKDMLEGKEIDVALGSIGHASVDIDGKGVLEVAVSAKIDLFAEIEKLAAKSGTKLDDAVVSALKGLLGRE